MVHPVDMSSPIWPPRPMLPLPTTTAQLSEVRQRLSHLHLGHYRFKKETEPQIPFVVSSTLSASMIETPSSHLPSTKRSLPHSRSTSFAADGRFLPPCHHEFSTWIFTVIQSITSRDWLSEDSEIPREVFQTGLLQNPSQGGLVNPGCPVLRPSIWPEESTAQSLLPQKENATEVTELEIKLGFVDSDNGRRSTSSGSL